MLENGEGANPLGIMEMLSRSSGMAAMVLLLLLAFSIVSWAIILAKFSGYKKAKKEDERFLKVFSKTESLSNIYSFSKELKNSPLARVFLTGYKELYVFQELINSERQERGEDPVKDEFVIADRDIKGIQLALNKSMNHEIERLNHRLDFLATTGSTTPFIGLFGTVWGIMSSFRMIGVKGSASIGGVAPGIAEALIATAAGLIAAIPAVIFYNYLTTRVRIFGSRMEDFSRDFIFMVERNFNK